MTGSVELAFHQQSVIIELMTEIDPANKAAKTAAKDTPGDCAESVTAMEPLLIPEDGKKRGKLADLALDLASRSTGLRKSLPTGVARALADLVRSMNCYYSNLIEGHDTHPIDIERALNDDYSTDPNKRDLQLEARAHIAVQKWIDDGGLDDRSTSKDGIVESHKRFCDLLPEDLLWVENPKTKERIRVIPGELRTRDVKVGRHLAVSPGAVPRFLERFETAYKKLGKVDVIIAAATSHHRLLWIHPFLDGNGRVARLMSYAMLREALETGGLWSIARGLARQESLYKEHLAACDNPRRNDLDGRGNLSEEALANFAIFFLETCIDQVKFMEELIQPDRLRSRILVWAAEEMKAGSLQPKSDVILDALLYRGEIKRGDVPDLLGMSERSARRIVSALIERGVLTSRSPRAPLMLSFPATMANRWMPGLFPEQKA